MSIRLLLADDHAIVRDGLRAILETTPEMIVIGEASTGAEALQLLAQLHPDVAIIDLALPDIDGFEVVDRMREIAPTTIPVLLTMHVSREHLRRAFDLGVRAYVLKESAGRELIEAVRTVMQVRRYISPCLTDMLLDLDTPSPLDRLSERERQVLVRVAKGQTSAEIAADLHLSPKTIETYRSRIMQKLALRDLPALVKFAIRHGLIHLDE